MKKLFSVVVIGSLLTLLIAATAQAQLPGTTIRASIPFDFIVRGRNLPAGNYEIRRISDEPSGLVIRNVDYEATMRYLRRSPFTSASTRRTKASSCSIVTATATIFQSSSPPARTPPAR